MKFTELPHWAKEDVLKTVTRWFCEDENTDPETLTVENKMAIWEYILDKEDYEIEYDEWGENPSVYF